MRGFEHRELRRSRHSVSKLLPRMAVTEAAECLVCNSVHLQLPPGHTVEQYSDQWQPFSEGVKAGVDCNIVFVNPNGQEVSIRVKAYFNRRGCLERKLAFEPHGLDGKKIRIEIGLLNSLRAQADQA